MIGTLEQYCFSESKGVTLLTVDIEAHESSPRPIPEPAHAAANGRGGNSQRHAAIGWLGSVFFWGIRFANNSKREYDQCLEIVGVRTCICCALALTVGK